MQNQIKPRMRAAIRLLPWFVFFGSVLTLLATPASAAVQLVFFKAAPDPFPVFLEWETATELDNAGFIIRRNQTGGTNISSYTQVPVIDATSMTPYTIIPARGDSVVGANYPFYDDNVTIGSRYFYYLQDIDINNQSSYNGPVEVVAGQTFTPTPTPTNTSQAANTATPTRTSTPVTNTPTRTPLATATATNSSSSNPTATQQTAPTQSPTIAPTLEPNITPVDATLTAIALAVTELEAEQTITSTSTLAAVAQAATETPEGGAGSEASPVPGPTEADNPAENAAFDRLILLGVIFFASGLLLTGGIIYLARLNQNQG